MVWEEKDVKNYILLHSSYLTHLKLQNFSLKVLGCYFKQSVSVKINKLRSVHIKTWNCWQKLLSIAGELWELTYTDLVGSEKEQVQQKREQLH